ncbi:hypothetical protein Q8G32_28555 [Priestia megaterium]|uniref:hypothetical protein n=1 Tax=Priestia megaterium TaxID=1404 RepID=UPI0027318CE0|nr:hypothetical protein [Priestia megaterium]MDP1471794.1 hypothetical protein [Priestia megaterium]
MKQYIKKEIIKFLNKMESSVSFIQLENHLKQQGIVCQGEYSIHIPDHPTIMMWQGMSEEFAKAILELLFEDFKIMPIHASKAIYALEGKEVNLPIAEHLHYEDEIKRWAPITLKQLNFNTSNLVST